MTPHQNRMIVRGLLTGGVLGKRRYAGQVSMRAQEVAQKVEIFLPYGMSANPVPGATGDVVVFEIAGTRDHLVGLHDDSSLRLAGLNPGEFGFQDNQGQTVVFKQSGIVITSGLGLTIAGNVTVNGTLTATTDVIGGGKSLKSHIHGGVQPGGGNTGAPV
jgi:phage gp45-like